MQGLFHLIIEIEGCYLYNNLFYFSTIKNINLNPWTSYFGLRTTNSRLNN